MAEKLKKTFMDTKPMTPLAEKTGKVRGKTIIEQLWSLAVGVGTSVFRADISGIWLGAKKWLDAPFRVDMQGNLTASSVTITGGSVTVQVADADTVDGQHASEFQPAGTYTVIRDNIALTNQGSSIGATNITNSQVAGRYRISYDLLCTTLDAGAISVLVTFAFTDAAGATTVVSATLPLTALDRTTGVFYLQLASGNLTYATTVDTAGTSKYALYITSERLA